MDNLIEKMKRNRMGEGTLHPPHATLKESEEFEMEERKKINLKKVL